jgi:hypothetical protein
VRVLLGHDSFNDKSLSRLEAGDHTCLDLHVQRTDGGYSASVVGGRNNQRVVVYLSERRHSEQLQAAYMRGHVRNTLPALVHGPDLTVEPEVAQYGFGVYQRLSPDLARGVLLQIVYATTQFTLLGIVPENEHVTDINDYLDLTDALPGEEVSPVLAWVTGTHVHVHTLMCPLVVRFRAPCSLDSLLPWLYHTGFDTGLLSPMVDNPVLRAPGLVLSDLTGTAAVADVPARVLSAGCEAQTTVVVHYDDTSQELDVADFLVERMKYLSFGYIDRSARDHVTRLCAALDCLPNVVALFRFEGIWGIWAEVPDGHAVAEADVDEAETLVLRSALSTSGASLPDDLHSTLYLVGDRLVTTALDKIAWM